MASNALEKPAETKPAEIKPAESKPEVLIYVDTHETFEDLWPPACVKAVETKNVWKESIRYVVEFEEKDLRMLKNTSSALHQKVYDDFTWIGEKLQMNMALFIGHIEQCSIHIETLTTKIGKGEKLFSNELPTAFIIIACHGDEIANQANHYNFSFQRNKIYSFGFKNLVHIYNGEIYNCELPHLKLPDMMCDYKGSLNDKKGLLNEKGNFSLEKYKQTEDPNRLAQCCEAKFARFSHIFVEYLNKRKCGKFTKEKIYEKLAKTLRSSEEMPLPQTLSLEATTFTNEDTVVCTIEQPCTGVNPFSKTNAEPFNEGRGVIEKLWGEMFKAISPHGYATMIEGETEPKNLPLPMDGQKLVDKLKGLGKDRDAVTNYIYPPLGNLLHLSTYYGASYYNHDIFIKELIMGTRDLKSLDAYGNPAVFNLCKNLAIKVPHICDILLVFFKRDKESLLVKNELGQNALYKVVEDKDVRLVEFFLFLYPDINLAEQGDKFTGKNLLHALSTNAPFTSLRNPIFIEEGISLVDIVDNLLRLDKDMFIDTENLCHILLAYGANPSLENQAYQTPLTLFMPYLYSDRMVNDLVEYPLPISEKIFVLFALYGYSKEFFYGQAEMLKLFFDKDYEYPANNYNSDRWSNYYNRRYNGGANGNTTNKNNKKEEDNVLMKDLRVDLDYEIEKLKKDPEPIAKLEFLEFFRENTVDLIQHAIKVFEFCVEVCNLPEAKRKELQSNAYVKKQVRKDILPFVASHLLKEHYTLLDAYLRGIYTSRVPKNYKAQIRQNSIILMKNKTTADVEKLQKVNALLRNALTKSFQLSVAQGQESGLVTNEKARNITANASNILKNQDAELTDIAKQIMALQQQILNMKPAVTAAEGGKRRTMKHSAHRKGKTRKLKQKRA